MNNLKLLEDRGKGRCYCFLVSHTTDAYLSQIESQFKSDKSRKVVFSLTNVSKDNWKELCSELYAELENLGIRNTSIIASEATSSIAQATALRYPKLIRSIVLFNPRTRVQDNFFAKIIRQLDHCLPLGLPLRQRDLGFDSKPFLQRFRAPVLIFQSPQLNNHHQADIDLMAKKIPSSCTEIIDLQNSTKILDYINQFEKVPAKCPQKNRSQTKSAA